jgi:hypothetical protein
MARERYSSYVQRAQSDSDAEEHIFVGGKDATNRAVNGGVRKRVGHISFWLEDRENRRERPESMLAPPNPITTHTAKILPLSRHHSVQNPSEGKQQLLDVFFRTSRVS